MQRSCTAVKSSTSQPSGKAINGESEVNRCSVPNAALPRPRAVASAPTALRACPSLPHIQIVNLRPRPKRLHRVPAAHLTRKRWRAAAGGLAYKFLIYFALWLSAVLSLWNGIKMLTGLVYGGDAALVYRYLPTLKIVDMAYGVLILLCAALAIYARFMLAQYRRSGPPCLYALYIATNAADLLYVAATSLLLGESTLNSQTSSSCVTSVIFLLINITYFQKRKHLFVN